MFNTTGEYTRLEYFTENVAADTRRKEFDIKNHSLIHTKNVLTFSLLEIP